MAYICYENNNTVCTVMLDDIVFLLVLILGRLWGLSLAPFYYGVYGGAKVA